MVKVSFTQNLQRHINTPAAETQAATVAEALKQVFKHNPTARSYILDDQGQVRRHIVIFVNGIQIQDRELQLDSVADGDQIYVMQALSGG